MDLIVKTPHAALWKDCEFRCAVGRGGIVPVAVKTEGDGATPQGRWKMREIIYRADHVTLPATKLPLRIMRPTDGWCEQQQDDNYNRLVTQPYHVPVDHLWRDDHLYDVIVVLGYNDDPVVSGKGSAIFLHLARLDFSPSAGCVTLALDDLMTVIKEADENSCVDIMK